ncbi:hypothetical protein [Collimonas humicola]|uniref:hypothetical protein n=1 Tax=Collimonas humicola TaxID=2825886 RepID=UPI001B8A9B19|nr:hypothetical protein [Collimonas humicola]
MKAAIQYAKIHPLTMQSLSSSSTYFYKFILPVLLAVVACVIYFRVLAEDRYNAPLVLFTSGVILFLEYWFFGRAKKISLDGATLVISNFRQEVRVPLSNLEKASGSLGMKPDVVWLYFRQATPFGKKILFVPTERAFPGFNQHPIVAMLNAKARTHH